MASDAAVADHRGDVTGSRLRQASQLGQGRGHTTMAAAAQSCCVADRRFPYYGKTALYLINPLASPTSTDLWA